jgi:hypothetical protein
MAWNVPEGTPVYSFPSSSPGVLLPPCESVPHAWMLPFECNAAKAQQVAWMEMKPEPEGAPVYVTLPPELPVVLLPPSENRPHTSMRPSGVSAAKAQHVA